MADPTDPISAAVPTDADLGQFERLNTLASDAGVSLNNLGTISDEVGSVFHSLRTKLDFAGISLGNISSLADDQAAKFGLITTSVLGAKEAYTSLAGVDTSRLVTFSGQISQLMDIIKRGPGTSLAADAITKITENMRKLGAPAETIAAALVGLKNGVTQVADAFFISADNAARLQNAMIQLTIQGSGSAALFDNLSSDLQTVGEDFENLGQLTDMYQNRLAQTMRATHLTNEQVANYAAMINRMPGGLKTLLDSTGVTTDATNILTDSIQYATGAGRKQEDVFKDMSQAILQYKVTGEDALRFSARMTEVADTLGAQVDDVQSALTRSADAFKMFVGVGSNAQAMTQGMAKAMEEYVSKLTSVGVPAQNAIDMFKNYTDQVGKMDVAQKAFLSAQSGGPGGLRGAFQIDAMIKRGDFEGLRRRTEDAIRKMTGPIVSFDEAQKSDTAAERYMRQIQILQQGPLGGQARTQQEAENLLEAMRTGRRAPVTAADDTKNAQASLQKTIERGQKIEELSHTELVDINTGVQELVMKAGAANLTTARMSLTGAGGALGGGIGGTGAGISPDQQEMLRGRQRGAAASPGSFSETMFNELGELVSSLPVAVRDSMKSFSEAIRGGSQNTIRETSDSVRQSIDAWKSSITGLPKEQQKAAMQQADNAVAMVNKAIQGTAGLRPAPLPAFSPLDDYLSAGKQVGSAIPAAGRARATGATTGATGAAPLGGGPAGQPIPVTLAPGSGITVNFTGKCPHCGWDQQGSTQTTIQSAPSALPR